MIGRIGPHTHHTHHTPHTTHTTHHTHHTQHTQHTNLGYRVLSSSPESQVVWLTRFVSILGSILVWRPRAAVLGVFTDGTPQWINVQLYTEVFLKNFTHFLKRRLTCSTNVNLDTEVQF